MNCLVEAIGMALPEQCTIVANSPRLVVKLYLSKQCELIVQFTRLTIAQTMTRLLPRQALPQSRARLKILIGLD